MAIARRHPRIDPVRRPIAIREWAGNWVAVKGGHVIAGATTSDELARRLDALGDEAEGASMEYVRHDSADSYSVLASLPTHSTDPGDGRERRYKLTVRSARSRGAGRGAGGPQGPTSRSVDGSGAGTARVALQGVPGHPRRDRNARTGEAVDR